MTIKKPATGAAIADRLKLASHPQPPTPTIPSNSTSTKAALIAGALALMVAGILTFILYQHWEFLKCA